MVGKNLMRHYFDLYCVGTEAKIGADTLTRQVALNDLCFSDGLKFGTVQAVGRLPDPALLVEELWLELERKGSPVLARLVRLAAPLIAYGTKRKISDRLILTAIMEDLPYESNSVSLAESGMA